MASEEGEGKPFEEEKAEEKTSSSSGAGTSSAPQKKNLSEMSDEELEELGYKRHSDGSIRDSKGHFAGNSGVIPGTPGVDAARNYLEKNGYKVSAEEISVKSSKGKIRRYDLVAEKDGITYGIEVKSGSATRTKQQKIVDEELSKLGGLKTVGAKAKKKEIKKIDTVKLIRVDENGNIIQDI